MSNVFPFSGQTAKAMGMAQVLRHAHLKWKRDVEHLAYALPFDWRGTGEDFRHLAYARGIKDPHTRNCWGAMVNALLRCEILEKVEPWIWVPPRDIDSHARPTQLLKRSPWI